MNFLLTDTNLIITSINLRSIQDILKSKTFFIIVERFLKEYTLKKNLDPSFTASTIIEAYELLFNKSNDSTKNRLISQYTDTLILLNEDLYNYWRKINRCCLLFDEKDLVETSELLNGLIISFYRNIQQTLMNTNFLVYRQLPAGFNALFSVINYDVPLNSCYRKLHGIPHIVQALLKPPLILKTKSNTRTDFFKETRTNILSNINMKSDEYCCYPIYVGKLKAYVYCHLSFLHHLISLSNLFEPIPRKVFESSKPDLICLFGVESKKFDGMIYHDKKNEIYVGCIDRIDKNDYFGYMKKMLLTLHNLASIDDKKLPIHGAMVNIITSSGQEKNIVVIGDSGAGKSETLEALRVVASSKIKHISVIFDDMGIFYEEHGNIVASGTEIGAFVRLDDLEDDYVYQELDRAIFINPNQKNARVVLPISNYQYVIKSYPIHMVLYANNYSKTNKEIEFYSSLDDALMEFINGKRLAKGTTSEIGMTKSFFANPFGPLQRKKQTLLMIQEIFGKLYSEKIPIGTIYTKLGLKGYEIKGPQSVAQKLMDFLD